MEKEYNPKSCESCKHLSKTKSYIHSKEKPDFEYFCGLKEKQVTLYVTSFINKMPEWCPLKK